MIIKKDEVTNCKIRPIVLASKMRGNVSWIPELPVNKKDFMSGKFGLLLSSDLLEDAKTLVANCIAHDGIGLSANQINMNKRMFTIRSDEDSYRVYFHPSCMPDTMAMLTSEAEGCLSVPGVDVVVSRPYAITAEWFEFENGILVHREERMEGMQARVFQHELDHLSSINIIDRSNFNRDMKRKLMKSLRK